MRVRKTLCYAIGATRRESRNAGDSPLTLVRRWLWTAIYLARAVLLGMRAMRREQLGSNVLYQGKRCVISNWAGSEYPTLADGRGFYREHVPRAEITNLLSLRELLHRFNVIFNWYCTSWLNIDVNKKLMK